MSKSKAYQPRFTSNGKANPEFVTSTKKNPSNFQSEFDKIDHVATNAHKARFNAGLNAALVAETGRTGSNEFLKSI